MIFGHGLLLLVNDLSVCINAIAVPSLLIKFFFTIRYVVCVMGSPLFKAM